MAEALSAPTRAGVLQVLSEGRVSYARGLNLQKDLVDRRHRGEITDTLLLLEHDPVFTVGRDGRTNNLLVPPGALPGLGIEYHSTDRGGDITYHGPGQLVGYPIFDLRDHRRDVRWFVGAVEAAVVRTLAHWGLEAHPSDAMRGVYVGPAKIGAIGIHVSRWITSHGFALNVSPDLTPFSYINPCGVSGAPVTSMEKLLPACPRVFEVADRAAAAFADQFGLQVRS